MATLTPKQQAFIEHYLICWNASEAARRAGYASKSANREGTRLLSNDVISTRVQERLNELKATADEVLVTLTQHKRGSLEDFINDDGSVNFARAREAGQMHLLKRYKVTKRTTEDFSETTVEIELHDAQTAAIWLGKTHKLFIDRVDATSAGEKIPIAVIKMDVSEL